MKKRRLIVVIAAVALLVFPSICANSTSPAMNECSWQSGRVCETDSIQLKGLERKLDSLTDLMRYTRQELRSVRRAYLSITYLKAVPMDSLYVRDSVLLASQKAEVQRLFAASELKLVERIQKQNAQIDKLKCYNVIATVLILLVMIAVCLILKKLHRNKSQEDSWEDVRQLLEARLAQGFSELSAKLEELTAKPEVMELSPQDVVAYNDGVQAFVNINNFVYDLRQHGGLIVPLLRFLADVDREVQDVKSLVKLEGLSDAERSQLALLVSKIEQFKRNNQPAIERYLKLSGKKETYADCVRFPLDKGYEEALDQNLLGDDMQEGQIVKRVFKLGFYFPDAKSYPYREKSLVL